MQLVGAGPLKNGGEPVGRLFQELFDLQDLLSAPHQLTLGPPRRRDGVRAQACGCPPGGAEVATALRDVQSGVDANLGICLFDETALARGAMLECESV